MRSRIVSASRFDPRKANEEIHNQIDPARSVAKAFGVALAKAGHPSLACQAVAATKAGHSQHILRAQRPAQ
jgi:hypothetical protein